MHLWMHVGDWVHRSLSTRAPKIDGLINRHHVSVQAGTRNDISILINNARGPSMQEVAIKDHRLARLDGQHDWLLFAIHVRKKRIYARCAVGAEAPLFIEAMLDDELLQQEMAARPYQQAELCLERCDGHIEMPLSFARFLVLKSLEASPQPIYEHVIRLDNSTKQCLLGQLSTIHPQAP